MLDQVLRVPEGYCGPAKTGHGGYVCGLLAQHVGGSAAVRLRKGAPIDIPMTLKVSDGGAKLFEGSDLIAEAKRSVVEIDVPDAPTFAEATEASKSFVAMERHPFPHCFVCGPQREAGDGLRIFPGVVEGRELIAAPWMPDSSLAEGVASIKPEYFWAVSECVSGFTWYPHMVVLGGLEVHVESTVAPHEECVVVGWQISSEGRKYIAGSAIYSENSKPVAVGRATWIELPREEFVALSRNGKR